MGQLEKYGLYVLCLVIFLILGVSIWGGGDLPPQNRRGNSPANSELKAGTQPAGTGKAEAPAVGLGELADLLRPADRPKVEPKGDPKKGDPKSSGGSPVNASVTKGGENPGDKAAPPTGEVAKPVAPVADVARKTHKVQSGDTFESISKLHFGSSALRAEIGKLNARLEPTKLKLGQEVLLPTAAEAQVILERSKSKPATPAATAPATATSPAPVAAAGTYRIVKGDTLEGIALRELGSRSRVAELQEANPGVTVLKIGSVIKLPKK